MFRPWSYAIGLAFDMQIHREGLNKSQIRPRRHSRASGTKSPEAILNSFRWPARAHTRDGVRNPVKTFVNWMPVVTGMTAKPLIQSFHSNISYHITHGKYAMGTTVKMTISLPEKPARETEETARSQGKTFSAVIQGALRLVRSERQKQELKLLQDYWSKKATKKGIITTKGLERYLNKGVI